jgi:integrase
MAKMNLLTDLTIRKAKIENKETYLNDGAGLRICIKPNGSKVWQFRYTFEGKRRKTTFKTYPIVSLSNAREKRDEYLEFLIKDIDPIEHKRNKQKEKILDVKGNFLSVAVEWLSKEAERTMPSTHKGKIRVFENDIYPFFKDKHISEIEISDIIKVIEVKKLQAHEVASKIYNYLDNLFRFAVLRGYCDRNLLSDIRKSDIIRGKEAKHYSKITNEQILCELRDLIYNYNGSHSLKNVLKFVLHVPLRADNLCTMEWDYINFEEKSLTIPRERMKIKSKNLSDFKIPLTNEIMKILEEQSLFTGHQKYVFLGNNNRNHINKESPNRALQRLGFNDEKRGRKIRLHGFRGTFRSMIDTLDVGNRFSFELKERILDHHEQNETVRAYTHRADYFEQFKPLMEFWSDYILNLKSV